MAPRKLKESKKLKQTTLFEGLMPVSPTAATRSPQRRATRQKRSAPTQSRQANTTYDDDSDDISEIRFVPSEKSADRDFDEDEDAKIPSPTRATNKRRRIVPVPSESGSEDEIQFLGTSSPVKQIQEDSDEVEEAFSRKKRRLRRREPSEDQSEEEDLGDLGNEVDEDKILDSRLRTRDKRSAFQKNLDILKRRKLKGKDAEEEEEEEEAGSEEEEELVKPFKGSKPTDELFGDSDDGQSDSDGSSDFIVEDDNIVVLPAEFSMETHEDLSHQFKKVFQFFVHLAVQVPKKRATFMSNGIEKEQYFSVPLQVMRRKLSGLKDSGVTSSVWRPGFRKSLEKYPDLTLVELDFVVPSCDACHLGGRVSKRLAQLSGDQYNPLGFEALPAKKTEKRLEKEFHLGRFCARRTKVYHQFCHWEHSLFQTIRREIDELKTSTANGFHRVAFSGGQAPPEDLEDADALVDWLDQRNVIDIEWQKLNAMMESARELEIRGKKGEDDD